MLKIGHVVVMIAWDNSHGKTAAIARSLPFGEIELGRD
jgi:hypothetical protein